MQGTAMQGSPPRSWCFGLLKAVWGRELLGQGKCVKDSRSVYTGPEWLPLQTVHFPSQSRGI